MEAGEVTARRDRASAASRSGLQLEVHRPPHPARSFAPDLARGLRRRAKSGHLRGPVDGGRFGRRSRGGAESSQRSDAVGHRVHLTWTRPPFVADQLESGSGPQRNSCSPPEIAPTPGHHRPPQYPGDDTGMHHRRSRDDRFHAASRAGDRPGGHPRLDGSGSAAPGARANAPTTRPQSRPPTTRSAVLQAHEIGVGTPLFSDRPSRRTAGPGNPPMGERVRGRLLLARPGADRRGRRSAVPPDCGSADRGSRPRSGPHRSRVYSASLHALADRPPACLGRGEARRGQSPTGG